MAIQLASDPKIKINGEELEGYVFEGFTLTKRLLEPNCFTFSLRKEDMSLTQEDIKFELREKLLGALVECSVSTYQNDLEGDVKIVDDDGFFRGYIHHVKMERKHNKSPFVVHCTAYSVDVRMKGAPNCESFYNTSLQDIVEEVVMFYSDKSGAYNHDKYDYDDRKPLPDLTAVKVTMTDTLPYTVQYNESDYDFLKRLAKRYGQFFYHEDGKVVFGEMREYDPVTLRVGIDLDKYDYELNMNPHTGTVLWEYEYNCDVLSCVGAEFEHSSQWKSKLDPMHEMSESVFNHGSTFFNKNKDHIITSRSARIVNDEMSMDLAETDNMKPEVVDEASEIESSSLRNTLEQYVVADTVTCTGEARRSDLKLGSVITIADETNTGEDATDVIEHEPLKIIDLYYKWDKTKIRSLDNKFKAIPQKSTVPPYLERDEQGIFTYGDFDTYPHSGPQHGIVYDNKDPLQMGRVRVVLGWQSVSDSIGFPHYDEQVRATPWIRVAHQYAGLERGSHIVPEIGDEVIVGFEEDNAERPYVLACVHNAHNSKVVEKWTKPEVVENNEYKAFRSRNGHSIEVRDKGKHGYIKIYDENTHNYVLTFDTDRSLIRLESAKNIELDAKENIVIHAGKDINIEADNDINVTANNDIHRTALHNILDEADNDFENITGNQFYAHIGETSTGLMMKSKSVSLELEDLAFLGFNYVNGETFGAALWARDPIEINSTQKVVVKGDEMTYIESDATVYVKGKESTLYADNKVDVSTKGTLTLRGKGGADLDGGVQATVKGAIIKLN